MPLNKVAKPILRLKVFNKCFNANFTSDNYFLLYLLELNKLVHFGYHLFYIRLKSIKGNHLG